MGKNFDSRPYSINDFKEWHSRKELVLTPYFQRRMVWSDKARSYLIDTIIRGLPIPKIYMRHILESKTHKSIREIVDGQQRIRTVIDFLEDGFKVSKVHNAEFGGKYFSELSDDVQKDFLRYEISTDMVLDARDEFILDIFARLNTYTVPLNKQELRNAKYFGSFKQTVYLLGREFYQFWLKNKILSQKHILRMEEAELVSELVIAMIDGIQAKSVIDKYYEQYDDSFPGNAKIVNEFKHTIDSIGDIFEDTLENSFFHTREGFYTLFCVIYDILYLIKNSSLKSRVAIKPITYSKIRNSVLDLEAAFQKPEEYPKYKKFIEAFHTHSTSSQERKSRHITLVKTITNVLSK